MILIVVAKIIRGTKFEPIGLVGKLDAHLITLPFEDVGFIISVALLSMAIKSYHFIIE